MGNTHQAVATWACMALARVAAQVTHRATTCPLRWGHFRRRLPSPAATRFRRTIRIIITPRLEDTLRSCRVHARLGITRLILTTRLRTQTRTDLDMARLREAPGACLASLSPFLRFPKDNKSSLLALSGCPFPLLLLLNSHPLCVSFNYFYLYKLPLWIKRVWDTFYHHFPSTFFLLTAHTIYLFFQRHLIAIYFHNTSPWLSLVFKPCSSNCIALLNCFHHSFPPPTFYREVPSSRYQHTMRRWIQNLSRIRPKPSCVTRALFGIAAPRIRLRVWL